MKEFWNQRYAENEWVYGQGPNNFFKKFIDSNKRGTLLLPADGEGRNSVYAASKGWEVNAFDYSEVAQKRALEFADSKKVKINFELESIQAFKAKKEIRCGGINLYTSS